MGEGNSKAKLAGGLPPACENRIPVLVAADMSKHVEPNGMESFRILLAMTRLDGEPLDLFVAREATRLNRECRGLEELRTCLKRAFNVAQQLLKQLLPAMEYVSSIALHRDVNAHNILIDWNEEGSEQPRYGLIDFGLAVDKDCWRQEEGYMATDEVPSRVGKHGVCTWHHLDVGGDCRYWPISAWMQFLHGCQELVKWPQLCHEYQTLLDVHSLGITALQLLCELLPQLPRPPFRWPGAESLRWTRKIQALQEAWYAYWDTVAPLHAELMDAFHGKSDWDTLKRVCVSKRVRDSIEDMLINLMDALQGAGIACEQDPEFAGMAALCDVLRLMIGSGNGNTPGPGGATGSAASPGASHGTNAAQARLHGPDLWRYIAEM